MTGSRHDASPERDDPTDGLPVRSAERGRGPVATFLMQVAWPAFLGAIVSVGVLFSLVDPLVADTVHTRLGGSREAAYTIAFLALWCLHAFACGLTWLLASTDRAARGGR